MDAVKFLQERNRMYESGAATPGIGLEDDYDPVSAVKVVEEWSAVHPRKTRQSVFLKQWPKAPRDNDNLPTACPKHIDVDVGCVICTGGRAHFKDCGDCRREFWMQEVE